MLQNYQDKMMKQETTIDVCPVCGGLKVKLGYITKKFEQKGQISLFKRCKCNQKSEGKEV